MVGVSPLFGPSGRGRGLRAALIPKHRLRAVFFDLADLLAYLWVARSEHFAFLSRKAGVRTSSAQVADAGDRAFLRTRAPMNLGTHWAPSAGAALSTPIAPEPRP